MKSSLDYVRWAREQAPARGLKRGQAQILNQLAAYANSRGECYPHVETLAAGAVLSTRQTERVLRELGRLGLIQTERRGRGRAARRRLCPHAPLPAPTHESGTPPLFDGDFQPLDAASHRAVGRPVTAPADPPPAPLDPPSGWRGLNNARAPKEQSEETADPPNPPQAGGDVPAAEPVEDVAPARVCGGRRRDRGQFARQMRAWAAVHFPDAVAPDAVGAAVSWLAARTDGPVTADAVRRLAASSEVWASQLGPPGVLPSRVAPAATRRPACGRAGRDSATSTSGPGVFAGGGPRP
jgi:hypothetical protein